LGPEGILSRLLLFKQLTISFNQNPILVATTP
jgi:hypothetical protein